MPAIQRLRTAAAVAILATLAPAAGASAGQAIAATRPPLTLPAVTGPAGIHARAAELYDLTTKKQLWGRDQYSKLPIASITKIMTALVVITDGDLTRPITITQADLSYARNHGASNAGLHAGDVLTADQLLYAMLLPSGADAARALAVSYGPGWRAFVGQMNTMASKLGLAGTHFDNFDGLPWPSATADQSTARNLLILGRAAMAQPDFAAIVALRSYSVPAGPQNHAYDWKNTNLLLSSYPGVIGIKTGWTDAAGECLLFEAVQGTQTLIGVVLHSAATNNGTSFTDATNLLNWGFGQNQPAPAVPVRWPAGVNRE